MSQRCYECGRESPLSGPLLHFAGCDCEPRTDLVSQQYQGPPDGRVPTWMDELYGPLKHKKETP